MKNRIFVDYGAIAENVRRVAEHSGKGIFAVVKNNAYNLGLAAVTRTLTGCGVNHFAVTLSEDALFIKERFPEAYVLQLNPANGAEARLARERGIALSLGGGEWFREYADALEGIDLHMEINAGMNRFGFSDLREASEVVRSCRDRGLSLKGLYTHFALSEEADLSEHSAQVDLFAAFREALSPLCAFEYVHGENTAAVLLRDRRLSFCNFVRPGIMLFGYSSREPVEWLRPSLFVSAEVIDIRRLRRGERLGYGTSFAAERDMKVATLPMGYGDGLMRARAALPVYVNGSPCAVVGKILMSHTFIEAFDGMKIGDTAEIYGERVKIDALASRGIATNAEQMAALHIGRYAQAENS
ncbi:MAG: alanine racemase [Synergistaceae bacterium]|jgi:alanine racemase|nr:alanine racemase [Synergistaceae bacterium]